MQNEDKNTQSIKLPERLVTPVDLARILREVRILDDWLNQANMREAGKQVAPPRTSVTLEEVASLNGVSLLEPLHREKLISALAIYRENAPKIHMSFAVEPSAVFLHKMIVWLRKNIHPMILLEVGLQPTLAAGCTVRTVNKMFDLSLRNRFIDSRPLLVQSIAKFQNATEPNPAEVPATSSPQTTTKSAPPLPTSAEAVPVSVPEAKTEVKAETTSNTEAVK